MRVVFEDVDRARVGEWSVPESLGLLLDRLCGEAALRVEDGDVELVGLAIWAGDLLVVSGKRWEAVGTRSPVGVTDDPWSRVIVVRRTLQGDS